MSKQYIYVTKDDVKLYGDEYEPQGEVKAVLLIVHGMAEHRKRYADFANFLADNGIKVYAYDQRGHGETAGSLDKVGYMSDIDNFNALVEDVNAVVLDIKEKNPGKKVFLLGHSMGSFISQRYSELYGANVDGVILSGTNYVKSALFRMGKFLASIITSCKGRKYRSKFLDNLSFGSYNKKFKPNRTAYDWLSVNEENVDKYIADEYCGNLFTCSFFKDLLGGFKNISDDIDLIRSDLPIYLIAGSEDPVGNASKGPNKLYKEYNKKGIKDLEIKLYEGKRHEILNEDNKQEVYDDVYNWLIKHLN